MRGADGAPAYFISVVEDASERKRAEAALRERTAALEALVETAPIAVWFTYDPDLREVRANRFASEVLGLPRLYSQALSPEGCEHFQIFLLFKGGWEVSPEAYPLRRAVQG